MGLIEALTLLIMSIDVQKQKGGAAHRQVCGTEDEGRVARDKVTHHVMAMSE